MKLLIIGGTGVLSTATVNEALSSGMEITLINRGHRMERIPKGVSLIKADCRNDILIKKELGDSFFDSIIDFVCYDRDQVAHSIELFSKYAKQYIFISSAAVIDTRIDKISDENSKKVLPGWDYSVSKWDAENCVREICSQKKIDYTIVRPCVTYDNTRIPYGFAPQYGYHWTLISRAKTGKPIVTWNNGINRFNVMRVEDFAVGMVGIIGNEKAYNREINICGDEKPSFLEIIQSLEQSLGLSIPQINIDIEFCKECIPERSGELEGRSHNAVHSNALIKTLVPGFKQNISLSEGICMTLKAYQENNYQRGIDWIYDAQCDYLIKKWCKHNKINKKQFHLGFKDYLGNASFQDKIRYYSIYFQDLAAIKLAKRIKRII